MSNFANEIIKKYEEKTINTDDDDAAGNSITMGSPRLQQACRCITA
jgi:hypothetical protein